MKKRIRFACAGAVLAGMLTVSALAADFTASAEHLSELGLFRGSEQGYELDRAPTRGEAAAMLVRLLGAEDEAQAMAYTAPFTDLADWQKPYVQYLYEGGLTNGASATAFEPEGECTAQMYAAFLLRALGYTEAAGDFTYAQAVSAAQEYGVYDPAVVDTADFLRDDVAAASYTALSLTPKGAEGTLLDRLVADGAVNAQAAARYQALFDTYAEYRADTEGMDALTAFSINSEYLGGVGFRRSGADGETVLSMQTQEAMTFDRAAGTMQANRVLTLSAPGVEDTTVIAESELADGVMRRRLGGDWSEQPVSMAEQARLLAAYGPVPLDYIGRIDKGDHADYPYDSRWTISFDSLPALYGELMWPVESTAGSLDGAEFHALMLVQNVADNRIMTQGLTVEFTTQDGIYGMPVLVSRLDPESE